MLRHGEGVVAGTGDRVKAFPEFLDAVDSEMIPVGGEHGLVVWQVLLDAQARGPP
jgi:hypothetical protein